MNSSTDPAVRESAAFFDLSGWSTLQLHGRDTYSFLHNFCTNEIKALPAGRVCEAFVTNVKARVLGHVFVLRWPEIGGNQNAQNLDEPRLILFGSPGQNETLAAHLDRYLIREEVTIEDETPHSGATYVYGPKAAALVDAVIRQSDGTLQGGPVALAELDAWEIAAVVSEKSPLMIARLDLFGQPGLLILHDVQDRQRITERLTAAGCIAGGPERLESLRIDACFPYYGIDVGEDRLAPEVDRPWAINYTKGCYLGQEPIARIDALGHVNKLLRGLRLETGPIPEGGAAVVADGKEIGSVTSTTTGLDDGKPIALAYVRSKFSEPGTVVTVHTEQGDVPATVFGLRLP